MTEAERQEAINYEMKKWEKLLKSKAETLAKKQDTYLMFLADQFIEGLLEE